MRVRAAFLFLLLLSLPAASQEFKRPVRVPRERYVFGLPVAKVKEGSRFAALRLVPQGWECFIVAVNRRQVSLISDFDAADPDTIRKARDCTAIHEDLGAGKGDRRMDLTVVVKKIGNSRGLLINVVFPAWDAGLVYHVKKWTHDLSKFTFPNATTGVGAEPFVAKIVYGERERLLEVADFELLRRDKEELRKNPKAALKTLESFKVVQRRLMIDRGEAASSDGEKAYVEARSEKAGVLSAQSNECRMQKEWLEAYRAAVAAAALGDWGWMRPGGGGAGEAVMQGVKALDAEEKGRVKVKAAAEASASMRDKQFLDAAEAITFLRRLGDPQAEKLAAQAKRAAFSASEMSKDDLDEWAALLGPPPLIPAMSELKADQAYRAEGKVAKAGAFTLVESGKDGAVKWVFEDKIGLKFDAGDAFALVAVYDGGKPPAAMPEELKAYPLLRIVVIR